MPDDSHVKSALAELRAVDRGSIPAELTETYERALEDVETLCENLEAAADAGDQPAEDPETPDEWTEDEWDDQLAEAREKADIPASKGTLTTKTIDGRDYYYLQWREGDTVTSQYVGPVDPA
ncbi:hypothetical protein GOC83_19370 [Haloarcula rubripromontorii]|uniref:DUF6788 domain-containing protein n=1 Tax=Haloarcula rubripromontorii TaxID=1705562 RepID=A0A847UBN8_9EURY|nr:hypothetical protein [Haloarcula rubripromontorii]NLV08281.1 hypothetical protein [Haloarcula rubripromontorii]